jgi:hypothetical protein
MFMRYTYFGIGHSPMLRRIAQDCLSSAEARHPNSDATDTASNGDVEDVEEDEVGDSYSYNEFNYGQDDGDESCEDYDDEFSGEELDEEIGEDDGEDGYDDPSF